MREAILFEFSEELIDRATKMAEGMKLPVEVLLSFCLEGLTIAIRINDGFHISARLEYRFQ